jgi:GNAT superfamily N-acetyltransferase
MARAPDRRYRFVVVAETCLAVALRRRIAALLSLTLDDGDLYRERAWRTLAPAFRVVALGADGDVVGQGSCFAVPCTPAVALVGLGDVAVDPDHRRRGIARTLCRMATQEAWRRGARAALAKTVPLRSVLSDLGYVAVEDFRFYYELDGACVRHPNWMAAVRGDLPHRVRLAEGDF